MAFSNTDVSILSGLDVAAIIRQFLQERGYEQVTDLCRIMQRYGSDKGLGWHNYTPLYRRLFEPLMGASKAAVFELGIGTNKPDAPSSMGLSGCPGASLRGWGEWLPHVEIYSADIDREILFQEERVHTFYVDQRSPEDIYDMWNAAGRSVMFDVILDDGLHEVHANDTFLCASYQKLKKGGIYIIEDILPFEVDGFRELIEKYRRWFRFVEIVDIPNDQNSSDDNRLLVLQK
jgi:hypothetical protein